ncbi:unnamed protein product [Rotaria magnacalcarata]|uniref:SHSP domain-containing protein n=1 Tax=Rotaria magnacalcarata TaxID=392030 RepID=A0A819S570_9BILA|nr:unnamed protein product [Rotaria magnacalcarata]CAF2265615.1 unnamed protein product [Rotaria magnacalcarata]CAF3992683.1 unnamed protein product [Rotaria magnacalcarata]CAF4047403.1 unnamed protein product [Rotaria magnacalcarata]
MSSSYSCSLPFTDRIATPIRHSPDYSNYQDRIPSKDTTAQWIYDPTSGREKFRVKIHIEGFDQNEVYTRVDGCKLFVYGERIENKSQGLSKRIIEKSYDLPPDVDTLSSRVTFPSPITMQVDFSSKYLPVQLIQPNQYALPRKLNATDNHRIPILRRSNHSIDSTLLPIRSNATVYKFHQPIADPVITKNSTIYKNTHRENHLQRSSPTLTIQWSHERSDSPTSFSSMTDDSDTINESSFFSREFNADAFYRSVFQPKVFTDDRDQRYIEMKLDMKHYNPDKIQVSINDNDLAVHADETNFYKQITLPVNIDLSSLSLHYHDDRQLNIRIKLLDEYSSFKYI